MVQGQEAVGVGLSLGMKANISNCFLLPENLSLFYCCSSDSGVNPSTILALENVCRNSGWGGEYTNILLVLPNTTQTPLAVLVWEQLDEFAFKTQLFDLSNTIIKQKCPFM